MARRRALAAKYSPTQPRIPAGNPRGGEWTDRSGGQGTAQGIGEDAGQGDLASLTQPMGNVDMGDVSGSSELGDLFNIRPADTRTGGVQLAANDTPDGPTGPRDPTETPIREAAPLVDPAPKIPQQRPTTTEGRMDFVRDAIEWVARNMVRRSPAVDSFFGALKQIGELKALT